MQHELKDKRLVITGAASGIGRATSILAAAEGAKVLAVDLADGVSETVRHIVDSGGHAVAVQADVSDEDAVAGFVERCVTEFGGILPLSPACPSPIGPGAIVVRLLVAPLRNGKPPIEAAKRRITLQRFRWQRGCRGLYELPVAV
jgi:NAD(P)-dependent dehydrogenase (short-subunit alcohol dehydrogenase family)